VVVELAQDTAASRTTRDQLLRLLGTHELEPWLFTRRIRIDEETRIPHSHPVLTLNTRHTRDDELLLSTFVHEQLHWFLDARGEAAERARAELVELFPDAPVGGREGGSDRTSTYSHLIVCYLEKRAVGALLGELRAREVMEFWAGDHYTWIYRQVIDQGYAVYRVLERHGLLHPPAAAGG
jgi:hypothetical protein